MPLVNAPPPIQPTVPVAQIVVSREERGHELRPEQFIQASVAEGGEERVLLDMGYQRVWAETKVPFQSGQKLTLVVIESSPRLILQLLEIPLAERITHLVHQLSTAWKLLPLLELLTGPKAPAGVEMLTPAVRQTLTAWQAALSDPDLLTDGTTLRELLRSLGLRFEAELAGGDVATAAASLKHALLGVHSRLSITAAEPVDELLQMLELFQLCNLALIPQGAGVWPLPLPMLDNGYLIVERPGAAGDEAVRTFSLHLAMPALGTLRIDFLRDEDGLYLRVVCAERAAAEFIRGCAGQFPQYLGGIAVRNLTVLDGDEALVQPLIGRVLGAGRAILKAKA